LELKARNDIDWGQKTVALVVTIGGQPTYFLRPLQVERNPDLLLASHIIDASRPVLRVTNEPHPYCVNATAKEVVVALDGQRTRATEIPSGRTVEQSVSLSSSSATSARIIAPSMNEKRVTLQCTGSGQSWEKAEKAWLASVPSEFPRHKDAVQPVVVFNPSNRYLENETVSVAVKGPGQNLFLLDSHGTPVASQVEGGTVWFLVMVPPHEGRTYYLCKGTPPEVSTDLALKTDSDTDEVTLSNLSLSMTLAPKQGGTATHLISRTTGLDYGQESFGVNYGRFSSYNPTDPAVQTTQFIDEHKTRQSDAPATIRVLSRGPVRCVVQVEWKDRNVQTTQTYEFRAYQPYFRIATRVAAQGGLNRLVTAGNGNEVVVLDARVNPNRLTKSFPNFVGMVDDQEHPHFGWREGRWVPPYLTLMSPDTFEESLSLIVETQKGLNLVRQGFWPADRPNSGRCERAELELVCSPPWPGAQPIQKSAEAQCIVLFHSKHQVFAQAFREALQEPPLVVTPEKFSWSEELKTTIADVPRDWLSTFWHYRARVEVAGSSAVPGEPLSATLDPSNLKGDSIDPNSIRVVEVDNAGRALALPIFAFDQDKGVVSWLPPKTETSREQRRFHLYFDSTANGPKPPARSIAFFPVNALHDQGFENEGERVGWSLSGSAVLEEGGAHAGQRCVRLYDASAGAPALLANNSIRVRPKTAYRVTYWAKTLKGSPDVRVNFFNGPTFDFEQVPYGVPPDGKWHRFECTLSGHDFPPGTPLAFRIWTLSGNCAVLIDDVEVAPLGSPPLSATRVTRLRVESLEAP
ncbi:MAG: hypothetical protein HY318_18535, partial [Armatimonadetes bacterium]|nr:hypothetical protein [Armatimonadota bacterium]